MTPVLITIFALVFFGAFAYAGKTVSKYWKYAHLAQADEIKTPVSKRISNFIINVLLQRKLMKRPVRGMFHVFVIGGFGVYGLHTVSQFIGGFMADYYFYIPALLDGILGNVGIEYVYDFILDIFTILVLSGLSFFALRRWVFKAPELDRPSTQSFIVITMIGLLMLFTLLGEPAKIIAKNLDHGTPIREAIASLYTSWGVDADSASILYLIGWWGHILTVLAFMAYVPGSKHAHLIWAPANFWFKKDNPKGEIPFLDTENAAVWGAANVHEFTWKNHLDGLSCIECGRCTIECPANRTGKVLNPKEIMTGLKHSLMEDMSIVEMAKKEGKSDEEMAALEGVRVIDRHISQEAIWACTTCYACVEACPVGNNQVDAILSMRRSLVLNEGSLPNELQNALTNIENQSNPWGVGSHKREEWAEGLEIKTMAQYAEENDSPDILFWVGCAGAFDDRNVKIARSIAGVLKKANVKFGILGVEENCTGDSARRGGNEYLYQMLAQTNIETMNGYGVKKIVTGCPHCFNTIQNEYPQLGGNYEVVHHSDYINDLIKSGKLAIDSEKAKELGTLAYHDSCYLGRYNDNYSSPREVVKAATGNRLVEAMDNHTTSLCCGAGGAQMWMEEEGTERVNDKRTKQLLDTGAETLATACPFCVTMIGDGVKGQGKDEKIKTLDIAEIVEKAVK